MTDLVSARGGQGATGFQPASSYNPSISADGGRVTYETSAGNQNFAKRYGRIGVLLCDLHAAQPATSVVHDGPGGPALADSQSAYNPVVSADGSAVAYELVRDGRTSVIVQGQGTPRVALTGRRVGGASYADPFEPGLSGDGTRVVATMTRGRVSDPASGSTAVVVRDLRAGATLLASRADGRAGAAADGPSGDGAISPDGGFVAFTSQSSNLGGPAGRWASSCAISPWAARSASPPRVGARSTRSSRAAARSSPSRSTARARSRIRVWHAATGRVEVVSRASGANGALGDGRSDDASISADGTRVAFTSTATNLAGAAASGPRAIYVRDLASNATSRVSDPSRAYAVAP